MFFLTPNRSNPTLHKVVGLVLVVPLTLALIPRSFGLGGTGTVIAIAVSVYGAWFASQHGSRRLKVLAVSLTFLNLVSALMLGTPSVLMGLGYIVWVFLYSPISQWLYWHF